MDSNELRRELQELTSAHHYQDRPALTQEEILELFAAVDEEAEASYRTLHIMYGRGVGKSSFSEAAKNITTPLDDESMAKLVQLRANGKDRAEASYRLAEEIKKLGGSNGIAAIQKRAQSFELEDTTRTYPTTNNRFKKRGRK